MRRQPVGLATMEEWGVAVVADGVRVGRGAKLAAKEMADEDLPDMI